MLKITISDDLKLRLELLNLRNYFSGSKYTIHREYTSQLDRCVEIILWYFPWSLQQRLINWANWDSFHYIKLHITALFVVIIVSVDFQVALSTCEPAITMVTMFGFHKHGIDMYRANIYNGLVHLPFEICIELVSIYSNEPAQNIFITIFVIVQTSPTNVLWNNWQSH